MRSLRYETLAEKFEEHSRNCNCSQLHLKQFQCTFHAVKPLHMHCISYLHECKLMLESIINFYLLEISLQVIAAPHILIWNTLVANSILKVLLDGIIGKVYASDYFKDINSSVFWLLTRCMLLIILKTWIVQYFDQLIFWVKLNYWFIYLHVKVFQRKVLTAESYVAILRIQKHHCLVQ